MSRRSRASEPDRARSPLFLLRVVSDGNVPLGLAELRTGQALADVATIGLPRERNVRRAQTLAEQVQMALNSRVVIEQSKGGPPSASG